MVGVCFNPPMNFSIAKVPNKILEIKCTCGKSVWVEGNETGWLVEFTSPPVFRCPCGEVIKVEIEFDDR